MLQTTRPQLMKSQRLNQHPYVNIYDDGIIKCFYL
jgi:hypothetical protein